MNQPSGTCSPDVRHRRPGVASTTARRSSRARCRSAPARRAGTAAPSRTRRPSARRPESARRETSFTSARCPSPLDRKNRQIFMSALFAHALADSGLIGDQHAARLDLHVERIHAARRRPFRARAVGREHAAVTGAGKTFFRRVPVDGAARRWPVSRRRRLHSESPFQHHPGGAQRDVGEGGPRIGAAAWRSPARAPGTPSGSRSSGPTSTAPPSTLCRRRAGAGVEDGREAPPAPPPMSETSSTPPSSFDHPLPSAIAISVIFNGLRRRFLGVRVASHRGDGRRFRRRGAPTMRPQCRLPRSRSACQDGAGTPEYRYARHHRADGEGHHADELRRRQRPHVAPLLVVAQRLDENSLHSGA